jgi:hypothetical protein
VGKSPYSSPGKTLYHLIEGKKVLSFFSVIHCLTLYTCCGKFSSGFSRLMLREYIGLMRAVR